MDIPIEQVRRVNIGTNRETAFLELTNGDKLQGILNLKPLELETQFGKAMVAMDHIRSLSFFKSDGSLLSIELKDSLVLYYSFDLDEGDKVADASGKGHDGKAHGATWTPEGKVGGACSFDGKSYIVATGYKGVVGKADFTVSMWVKLSQLNVQSVFVSWGHVVAGGEPHGSDFMFYWNNTSRKMYMTMHYAGWTTTESYLPDTEWHHLACSVQGTTSKFYYDGQFKEKGDTGLHDIQSTDDLIVGGIHYDLNQTKMNGSMDEVMVFNRILSEDDIQALYNSQK